MITELTKEQEEGIIEWRDHCLEIGRDTGPLNKEVLEECVTEIYRWANLDKPKLIYCHSPLEATILINALERSNIWSNIRSNIWSNIGSNIRSNIWSNIESNMRSNIGSNIRSNIGSNIWSNIRSNIGSNIWSNIRSNIESNIGSNMNYIPIELLGQHDISYIAYYKYYEKYGLLKRDDNFNKIDTLYNLANSSGWIYTFENMAIICEKPCEIHLDEQGRLHKNGGMALKYSDGYGLYMLHGVEIPEYLAMTRETELDINWYLKQENADIKAEFVRKYGVERMLEYGEKIDSYKRYNESMWTASEYELWDMASLFDGLDYVPYLKMKNQTTGIWHMEAVSPECRTLEQALNFRFGNRKLNIISIK